MGTSPLVLSSSIVLVKDAALIGSSDSAFGKTLQIKVAHLFFQLTNNCNSLIFKKVPVLRLV